MAEPVLTRVIHDLTRTVQVDTANTVRLAWTSLEDLSDESGEHAMAQVVPAVQGAQRLVADLHTQYLNRVTELILTTPEIALLIPEADWVRSPLIQARRLVSEDNDIATALDLAALRAAQVHSGDVLRARNDATTAYGDGVETLRPVRWAKVPLPDACSWCRTVSTKLFVRPDGLPTHLHDRCGLNAVTPADDLSSYTNVSTVFENSRWRSRVSTPELRAAQVRMAQSAERLAAQAHARMLSQAA